MAFHLITISTRDISNSQLSATSKKYGFQLNVISPGLWKSNIQKFEEVLDFLHKNTAPDDIVCFVDAFDVIANNSQSELLRKFNEFENSIVFGAEANFYMAQKELRAAYMSKTPHQKRLYKYLNSGTYIGRSEYIILLIKKIIATYASDYFDGQEYLVTSDQNFFSRAYIDQKTLEFPFEIRLDFDHALFGCTGGRMFVFPWLAYGDTWSFFYYKMENARLKKYQKKTFQNRLIDYRFDSFFKNTQTATRPVFMHCPGTHSNFEAIIEASKNKLTFSKGLDKLLNVGVHCFVAVLKTLPKYLFLSIRHGFGKHPIQNFYFRK